MKYPLFASILTGPISICERITVLLIAFSNITISYGKLYYPVRDRMECFSLDGTWTFKMDNCPIQELNVPANWEIHGVKIPEYGCDLSAMTGTYQRKFYYQEQWRGRDVILRLDGVQNGFVAFVNGKEVGRGHSAHTMHQFNVTPFLHDGVNNIELQVSTHSDYWRFDVCDAWSLSGIKRSVEMFSVPKEANLSDIAFTSKVHNDDSADIEIKVTVNGQAGYVTASLLDERYNHVSDLSAYIGTENIVKLNGFLSRPRLWNAETPNLYRLDVKLYAKDGHLLQSVEEKVGIREIRVENGKVLLNNHAIFLRGACLSENDAVEGGAMTPFHRRQQLQQMKDANINFIRTAHYPFDPVFTRLCDEMGFYVCEEIPFASRGDEYLKYDTAVVAELNMRAKATIDRDRNCPSIIMWSLGNENNIYACQDSVLKYVMEYDPSRLRGVPQTKGKFISFVRHPSKYVDVICGHYANDDVLQEACKKSKLPIINTEYAHSLGTAFGGLEQKYELFRKEPLIAGGSVWCFQDQSILTHNFNQQNQIQKGVRMDSLRYLDCYGLNPVSEGKSEIHKEGADGVVYGDGYPQEDYFELAQVYTPVYINDKIDIDGDNLSFTLENRFNFITLHGYSVNWRLCNLQRVIDEGVVWPTASPGDKEKINIECHKRDIKSFDNLMLVLKVFRPDGSLCFERNLMIYHNTDFNSLLTQSEGKQSKVLMKRLSNEGFLLRVGRKVDIGLDYHRNGLWENYLLKPSQIKVRKQKSGYKMTCRWQRADNPSMQYIDGTININNKTNGTVTIDYVLVPSDSISGTFLDYGLTMKLPGDYSNVGWLGMGPFSQTPDKTAYNNYDIWQLSKDDIRFYGNRAAVDLLTVMAQKQTPDKEESMPNVTMCASTGNVLLENVDGHICLTDNIIVGTYGNKFSLPHGMAANKIGQRSGHITLKVGVAKLENGIFGTTHRVNAENPYLNSYGK